MITAALLLSLSLYGPYEVKMGLLNRAYPVRLAMGAAQVGKSCRGAYRVLLGHSSWTPLALILSFSRCCKKVEGCP